MYLIPASAALSEDPPTARSRGYGLYLYCILMICVAGFRFEVGGDWGNYIRYLNQVRYLEMSDALSAGMEPAYYIANVIGIQSGLNILVPNLICSFIFFSGLTSLCLSMSRPWLAMAVAIPYLGIVVGMGYSRQAAALGFVMFAYKALGAGRTKKFAVFVIIAALFHKTAVIMLPVAILAAAKNRVASALWLGVLVIVAYRFSLESSMDQLVSSYVGGEMQSSGAFVRLFMDAIPAMIFIRFRRKFGFASSEERLWYWVSLISLGLLGALLAVPSMSTAVDRIALYFLPIQIVVFSNTHVFNRTGEQAAILPIIMYYAAVLAIWLNFATNSYAWVPFKLFGFS